VIRSKFGSPPEYLTKNCEQSVKPRGVDALDIFCMSRVDPEIPIEESVGATAKLVERGLTLYIGLSEGSAHSIRRARKVHPIASLQMEYSLWSRDPEDGNIQACREFNTGFMAYSPLGCGGSWFDQPELLCSSFRYRGFADFRNLILGFRLAQDSN
jgi:aryl-alcohol dehydrogenase-like predicted oxidoreductase